MGDPNIDLLTHSTYALKLKSLLSASGRYNTVTLPTRVTLENSSSINVCISNLNASKVTSGVFRVDFSDHMPIFLSNIVNAR